MSGIRVENLSKSFENFKAVDDVGFEVKEGELAAVLGPSGSGKSTILRIIAGLEKADNGQVYLTGRDVTGQDPCKRNVGFVFQHYALFKHMTVEENIAFGLEVRKKEKKTKKEIKQKVDELIHLVKLNGYNNHYPSQLSGGQRQRVALARALAPEPRVLLLDEPFGSLDAKVRKNLALWIKDLHKRINVTGIFVTHDQEEAMEIADKIILVNRGRVEQTGTPAQVYESPQTRFVASFVGNVNVIDAFLDGRPGENKIFIKCAGRSIIYGSHEKKLAHKTVNAVLLARPEEIDISHSNGSSDHLPGTISAVHYRGSFYEVEIDISLRTNTAETQRVEQASPIIPQRKFYFDRDDEPENSIKAVIDKNNMASNNWQAGDAIFIRFRDYKIFEAEEGFDKVRAMLKQYGYIE